MAVTLGLVFAASVVLCLLYRQLALRWQILDVPNERSAHEGNIPRGGGVGLLLAFYLGLAFLPASDAAMLWLSVALVVVGIIDDRRNLGISSRLLTYTLVCVVAAWYLLPETWPMWSLPLLVFGLLWLINLYNFMDGTDGIAALEAIQVLLAACILARIYSVSGGPDTAMLVLAAACCGFLLFNWPRANLFMGDAGSVPLGFLLGVLALSSAQISIVWLWVWLILLGAFIADATVTLIWRIAKGHQFTRGHSLHAYQRLSRHWGSHSRVLALLSAINFLWLLPIAALSLKFPDWAPIMLVIAYSPLVAGVLKTYKLP